MKRLIGVLLCLPVVIFAQERSGDGAVRFESGLSWEQVKAKANAENKSIFMDCYATWCGPCKFMDLHIFPLGEVGDFMNAHFINVRVQMDRTAKDAQAVRGWYSIADSLHSGFNIGSYPTDRES